ncbi:MAG: hypothetical protein UR26_C0006G0020 [candidate division TM6 bacterium GW2011_GWF2_32_72]|nr:MAG: hypothetical protein UR26_C0006G0020 [candidate division TM6 bacterium GW2011_GWF2_32_72]
MNNHLFKQQCLIVEGNVGAGKSTFLKILQKYFAVQTVFEPLYRWQHVVGDENLLDKFYKDTTRWAYTFQSYAFITRVLEQKINAEKNTTPVQILERSVYTDRYCFAKNCFEMGTISPLEWELYQEWFSWLVDNYTTKPDGFIYLQTDPQVCFDRMKNRNRTEENAIPLDYIQKLHNKHEEWLIKKNGVVPYIANTPVLVLECNEDFENNIVQQQLHVEKIAKFFKLEHCLIANHVTKEIEISCKK